MLLRALRPGLKPASPTGPAGAWLALGLVIALSCLHLACGKSKKLGPDTTPPGPVGSFTATVLGSDTVRLSWTAPGDDGASGRASAYELRQSLLPITEVNFPQGDTVGSIPTPAASGQLQQCYATNLPGSSNHYFAIQSADENDNSSTLTFIGPIHTFPDTIPPGRITDLAITNTTDSEITLAWTAPGDDAQRGRANRLELRYAGGTLGDTNWTAAHLSKLQPPAMASAGTRQTVSLTGLPTRVLISMAIRAFDESEKYSLASSTVLVKLRGATRQWLVQAERSEDAPTIQAAIDSALDGDVVSVGEGTFRELIDFKGKNITVRSIMGPAATILDGKGLEGAVIAFRSGEARSALIEGFTITGGIGVRSSPIITDGGGVYCRDSSPTIRGNIIRDNHLPDKYSAGGGIAVFGPFSSLDPPNPLIENNIIEENSVGHAGGGIELFYSAAEIRNNIIRRNRCNYDGAGIYGFLRRGNITIEGGSFIENVAGDHGGAIEASNSGVLVGPSYTIRNVLFLRNVAQGLDIPEYDVGAGGAISARQTQGLISQNTFVGNTGRRVRTICPGGAVLVDGPTGALEIIRNIFVDSEGCGIACYLAPDVVIRDNLFWSNTPTDIGQVQGTCQTDASLVNLFKDPRFCSPGSDDYRLSPDSPAIIHEEVLGAYTSLGCGVSTANPIPH